MDSIKGLNGRDTLIEDPLTFLKSYNVQLHTVKIHSIEKITHDVLQIVTDRPRHFKFTPGQATEVSINKPGWKDKRRPFTFTSLPIDHHLEFIIKVYPSHKEVTNELLKLKEGDELILHDVFGDIGYKGEGIFIAGGAGVTPFISILRYLRSMDQVGDNKLIFANKTRDDIILRSELEGLLGRNFINVLSDEKVAGYIHGFITEDIIGENITTPNMTFYVCGPPPMMEAVGQQLANLHIDKKLIVTEAF